MNKHKIFRPITWLIVIYLSVGIIYAAVFVALPEIILSLLDSSTPFSYDISSIVGFLIGFVFLSSIDIAFICYLYLTRKKSTNEKT